MGKNFALSKDGEGVHAPAPRPPSGRPWCSAFTRKLGGTSPCSTAKTESRSRLHPAVLPRWDRGPKVATGYSRVWTQPPHLPHTRVRAGGYLPSSHGAACCCRNLLLRHRRPQRLPMSRVASRPPATAIDHQRQLHDRPLKGTLVLVHSHASLLELVPVPQPKLRTSPGFSHLL